MIKKYLLFLTLLTIIGCSSSKPVVRTTSKLPPKSNKQIIHKPRKTVSSKPLPAKTAATETVKKAPDTRVTEVIESTSKTIVYGDVVRNYVSNFKDIAMGNMKTYGIPASIILAQGILESGAGKGDLALSANNHFGIKCHVGWTGESVRHDDDSDQECFRKYTKPSESYKDHALFLTTRSRYASLFQLPKGDYEAWAKGLRSAGYATDPKYPQKLISYIERYNLHQYDSQVLGTNYVPTDNSKVPIKIVSSSDTNLYEVQKGDTFYSISKKFNLSVDELKQKNQLANNTLSIGQQLKVK